ncbi:tetratricopeptide repeat protein [Sphingomonas sp. PAMC 26621]|uniref:tetratricopeptide repeat protein n=1 Tax=Sphingomonas sp. PAMC 26621 TaxID=1112213 RepID=UPI0002885DF4|nr:cytochrome c biosynthesis protein [Sphingomonas sp. PAMC 26621]
MNLLVLAAFGSGAAALLSILGVARRLWMIVGAALLLGATGFAVQSTRHQPGKPVAADVDPITVDPGMIAFRAAVFAPSAVDDLALASADGRLQSGDTLAAAEGLARDLLLRPDDATLWTAYGYALALHDHAVSPAAKVAFRRAVALAPHTPGPAFFLGMAYVDAGEFAAARPYWSYALSVTPRDAPYRGDIAERIAAIDQFRTMTAAQRTGER